MNLSAQQHAFIDDFAALWDQVGGKPVQGRVLALLYIANQSELSASDIGDTLGISRGSVSQTTRQLTQIRLIQRVSKPGDRRDWYRVSPNAWSEAARAERSQIAPFLDLMHRGLNLHNTSPPERQRALINSIAFLMDYDAALGSFLESWKPPNESDL